MRRNAGRIHFNAQLIDTRTDTHVWAEEYDRDVNDMFAIQSEVAQKVAQQLQAEIAPAQLVQIERKPTANLQAYEAYLRGMAHARAEYRPVRIRQSGSDQEFSRSSSSRSLFCRGLELAGTPTLAHLLSPTHPKSRHLGSCA